MILASTLRCNSWIVVSRATGIPVLETWSPRIAAAVNRERYEVLTALEWLQRLNANIRKLNS